MIPFYLHFKMPLYKMDRIPCGHCSSWCARLYLVWRMIGKEQNLTIFLQILTC